MSTVEVLLLSFSLSDTSSSFALRLGLVHILVGAAGADCLAALLVRAMVAYQ